MNLLSVEKDIKSLEKALTIIEKTENYLHFCKSTLIFDLCEQINILKEKRDRQLYILETLKN